MEQPLTADQPVVARQSWQPAIAFTLLLSYFVLFGIIIGGQGVLWADIVQTLGLSKSTFGLAQLVSPLVSVGLLLAGGQLTAWAGKKRLALVSLALLGVSLLLLAGAGQLWGLVGSLVVAGAGAGLLELAMNGGTLDWEQATRRNIMNIMHAGFSGGAVLGALGAGLLLGFGWGYSAALVVMAVLCGLLMLATPGVAYPPVDATQIETSGPSATLRLLFSRAMLVVALLCLLGAVGESDANLWSVIYLRELGAATVVGGAAFALFNGAMFVGRLLNAPIVERLGARFSLLVSGVLLVLANVLLMVASSVSLAIAGFVLLGLGVAGVIPTALVIASRTVRGNNGAITGATMAAGYSGFIICPPVIGAIADWTSLSVALLSVGLSGLAVLLLAWRLDRSRG